MWTENITSIINKLSSKKKIIIITDKLKLTTK